MQKCAFNNRMPHDSSLIRKVISAAPQALITIFLKSIYSKQIDFNWQTMSKLLILGWFKMFLFAFVLFIYVLY